ncbi:hypothetical protein [Streptomyces sp. B93]|uniref:hypothetical protein n=1 Tax=Streptomyces sp. B93 TaxID=2824875 RepID=UPI001B3961CB|nr:hypothetical protein [Streptomyces sp. B93]MBQ1094070.1 hypothetical protein [Streptomyces sp. B93]
MRRVVRGFWGPRPESVEALTGRWSATLARLAGLLTDAGGSDQPAWRTVPVTGSGRTLRPGDDAALTEALRTAQAADDWSAANGTSLRVLLADPAPGWKVEVAGLAGGRPEFLLQSLIVTVVAPDGARLPDAELLAAVAEAWQPDHGDATDRTVTAALKKEAGFKVGTPAVGWVGFLSPGRADRVPDGSDGRELPGVGVLLDIAPPGDDTAPVVRAYEALRDAGALDPLPQPMDRPVL